MTYPVKWYSAWMQGAPKTNGLAGSLVTMIDACRSGFGTLTLSSLTVSGGVATATISGGHAYLRWSVLEVAGASPSGLNGEQRVLSVTATQFTFDATGTGDQTATGTITVKVAGCSAWWDKPYSGTNLAVYRPLDPGSNQHYLRIDDNASQATDLGRAARVRGYETMSDANTGTGPFPTTAQQADPGARWVKSDAATAADRSWVMAVSASFIHLWLAPGTNADQLGWYFFGKLRSFKPADLFDTVLGYAPSNTSGNYAAYLSVYSGASGSYQAVAFARSHTGALGAIQPTNYHAPTLLDNGTSIGYGMLPSAGNPADGKFYVAPVYFIENLITAQVVLRGRVPGAFSHLHYFAAGPYSPWSARELVANIDLVPMALCGLGLRGAGGVPQDLTLDLSGDHW